MRHVVLALALASLPSTVLADTPTPGADVAPTASPAGHVDDPEVDEEAKGAFRIENEYKLRVPDDTVEPFREWLKKRYGTGPESILPELGPDFTVKFSDEEFTDRYFDDPELSVLKAECGIRHRTRVNLEDELHDRKHGRQLVQLKLRRPEDQVMNRTEIKFEVEPSDDPRTEEDRHPLIGLVDPKARASFIETAKSYGYDVRPMRNTITLTQRRWRVYVSKAGKAFATLTLDQVSSSFAVWKVDFTELEMELNEIAYTDASPEQRAWMQTLNDKLKSDIQKAFPQIVQDQTPKYNKSYNALSAKVPQFRLLLLHGDVVALGGLLALVGAAVGVAVVVKKKQKK